MICGQKVRLRAPERSDFESYARWVNNKEIWQYLGEGPVFESMTIATRDDAENWYMKWLRDPNRRAFSVEDLNGVLIGNCQLMEIDWNARHAQLAITIGEPDYWSHGYGTDAICLLLDLAFNGYNLHRVFLTVVDFNERAKRCYEKCGFRVEGLQRQHDFVDGVYHDAVAMSILEDEYRELRRGTPGTGTSSEPIGA